MPTRHVTGVSLIQGHFDNDDGHFDMPLTKNVFPRHRNRRGFVFVWGLSRGLGFYTASSSTHVYVRKFAWNYPSRWKTRYNLLRRIVLGEQTVIFGERQNTQRVIKTACDFNVVPSVFLFYESFSDAYITRLYGSESRTECVLYRPVVDAFASRGVWTYALET